MSGFDALGRCSAVAAQDAVAVAMATCRDLQFARVSAHRGHDAAAPFVTRNPPAHSATEGFSHAQ